MPRAVRMVKLESRTARAKLPARKAPYFVKILKSLQLGYRRGAKGGNWIARRYVGGKLYEVAALAPADDLVDADGAGVLDYWQAQERAKAWAEQQHLADKGLAPTKPLTIAEAIDDYLAHLTAAKGLRAAEAARYKAAVHILPSLGKILVDDISTDRLLRWRNQLSTTGRFVRGKKAGAARQKGEAPATPEEARARKANANRTLTVLKAALNHAYNTGKVARDDAWRRVKPFRKVDAPVIRYLSQFEITNLVQACEGSFRRLVEAALLTGCRYSELASLKVGDINFDVGVLTVRKSKSGAARHVILNDEAGTFFRRVTDGMAAGDTVFTRTVGQAWQRADQSRPMAESVLKAGLAGRVTFHVLRHTYASLLAMKGVPFGVIAAQLGHADTRMTEKHYAHLAPSYIADTVRRMFPSLGIEGGAEEIPFPTVLRNNSKT